MCDGALVEVSSAVQQSPRDISRKFDSSSRRQQTKQVLASRKEMEGDGLVIWGFRGLEDASSAGRAPSARVGTIKIAEGSGPLGGAADGIDSVDDELGRKKRREMRYGELRRCCS